MSQLNEDKESDAGFEENKHEPGQKFAPLFSKSFARKMNDPNYRDEDMDMGEDNEVGFNV